ncbi:MAG: serine/threonine-protein kinase, partial [Cyclobacteriaceae bacterium]
MNNPKLDKLNIQTISLIDNVCDDFETAFNNGLCPQIEQYLSIVPKEIHSDLLRELISVELELIAGIAILPSRNVYHQRFPEYKYLIDSIYKEQRNKGKCLTKNSSLTNLTTIGNSAIEMDSSTPDIDLVDTPGGPISIGGRYVLGNKLGVGAFGAVYSAEDRLLDRKIAIKKINHSLTEDPKFEEMFRSEARTVASLRHPNILQIHDFGIDDTIGCYVVSDLIVGGTFDDLIQESELNYKRVICMLLKIVKGMIHVHSRGIIHRDLKPSNILIDEFDTPIIADFGLALRRSVEKESKQILVGTPAYIAPEVILNNKDIADARCDIWALGVIFYELIFRERPFAAMSMLDLFDKIIHIEPQFSTKSARPGFHHIIDITKRCLVKSPEGRISSACQLEIELTKIIKEQDRPSIKDLILFRMHIGSFVGTNEIYYFLNVTNRSHDYDVVISHVWFDTDPEVFPFNPQRPLPVRL